MFRNKSFETSQVTCFGTRVYVITSLLFRNKLPQRKFKFSLPNYHILKNFLRRDPARGSLMADEGGDEPNDNHQACRLSTSLLISGCRKVLTPAPGASFSCRTEMKWRPSDSLGTLMLIHRCWVILTKDSGLLGRLAQGRLKPGCRPEASDLLRLSKRI
jgi:hypothetical protein